ncbi:hypothetical protein ABZ281_31935 [Streptomyces sp. NPDC006265]|uniref:hypothetical protein n=1 Tax=Streptomyces sp. NPDC006265 TaxID=3156740 RepID=UPI0033BF70EA
MTAETPEAILAAADSEIEQADAELAQLEQQVIDGDTDVTPDQIETARKHRWWAGLQRKQAEKKAAALRDAEATQARTVAQLEARRILDSVPQSDVDQAEQAAAEAMHKLRETVRARNDARARAIRVLRACPAIEPGQRPQGLAWAPITGAYEGNDQVDKTRRLWVDGQVLPALDEAQLMDRVRKAPATADHQAQQAAKKEAAARQIEQDAALYRTDPRAFEELSAARRKPALDSIGVDWDQYLTDPGRPRIAANRL